MLPRLLLLNLLVVLLSLGCEAPQQNSAESKPVIKGSPVTVMGRVYDKQSKQGLAEATVKAETGISVITNASGNYSINLTWPEDQEELLFTFSKPGYNPKELHLKKGKTVLETLLSPAKTE
ncbi:MAG: hypothetical protein KDC44_24685 [Phaeodactylibacter sp.]|nr:hypothetical protein [Phaeodactylibacter sp.]